MKKKLKHILSLALASAMTVGMLGTTAMPAAAAGVEDPCTEIEVSKTVTVTNKGTLLPTEIFHITMVPATAEDLVTDVEGEAVAATDANGTKVEVGPALATDTVAFTFDALDNTATGSVEKTNKFDLIFAEDFDHTGVYRYYVTETEATDADGNEVQNGYIEYDTTKYVVDLYVDQNSDGEYVVSNYVLGKAGADTKPPKISFTNNIKCANLMIYKEVKGTEYQQGELYTFRILVPVGGTTITLEQGQVLQAKIYDVNGVVVDTENNRTDEEGNVEIIVNGDDINADMAEYATEFKLKKGEWLQILGAPVTMVYKVEEVTDDIEAQGYTVTYNYQEYGANDTETKNDVDNQAGNSVTGTINTVSNEVTFVNTRNMEVPNSGITMEVLPYALALIVAVCGGILFIFARKRRTN